MLRRGVSETSVFTCLMWGCLSSAESDMVMIRDMEKVGQKVISSMTDFLADAVLGPDLRFEAVVSRRTVLVTFTRSRLPSLMDVCLSSGLVQKTSKNWPFYLNNRVTSAVTLCDLLKVVSLIVM